MQCILYYNAKFEVQNVKQRHFHTLTSTRSIKAQNYYDAESVKFNIEKNSTLCCAIVYNFSSLAIN